MTKNIAIKCRIYPNDVQQELFAKIFGCVRKIWNLMLGDANAVFKASGRIVIKTPAQYKNTYPYLKEVDSHALCNAQMHLKQAFTNHVNKPDHFGAPKFKAKYFAKHSYTTDLRNNNIAVVKNGIKLPKVGVVKAVIHRNASDGYKLKSVTVSQEKDGIYFASILYEYEQVIIPVVYTKDVKAVGLDYKSNGFYVSSDGETLGSPKYERKAQKKTKKLRRWLSRKAGGKQGEPKSKNYIKQQQKLAKACRKVANQRADFIHKESKRLVDTYDAIFVEDLNMKALSNKGFGNGRATMDNGYGMFMNQLTYKAENAGKWFLKVPKFYPSSQLCSCCGERNKAVKDLRIRKWICPSCGTYHDRDLNAAINIKTKGLEMLEEQLVAVA